MADDAATVRSFPLFKGMAKDDWTLLSHRIKTNVVLPNQTVYRVGDKLSVINMVIAGGVRIFITDRYGIKFTISDVAPGEFFGELPGSIDTICTSSAVALQQSQILVMDREFLNDVFSKNPDAIFPMLAALEGHLRRAQSLLRNTKLSTQHS